MAALGEAWRGLSPQSRRTVISVAVAALLLALLYAFVAAGPESTPLARAARRIDRNVLTGTDPKALGLDALGARIRAAGEASRDNAARLEALEQRLGGRLDALGADLAQLTATLDAVRADASSRLSGWQDRTRDELFALKRELGTRPAAAPGGVPGTVPVSPVAPVTPLSTPPERHEPISSQLRRPGLFANPPSAPLRSDLTAAPVAASSVQPVRAASAQVQVFGERPADAGTASTNDPDDSLYLPAGSLIRGVLLTGVDAPTSLQSRRDPAPALVRVKHEAILPNRFRLDVKECFLIVAASGELSTERANMRSEVMTCVRGADGGVIEVGVESYVVGEDGKAGMRGRLVHRNGQVVAKSLLAGFASGLANIYRPVAVQALNTSPGSSTTFQRPDLGTALESGAYGGMSSAMGRLAEYYLELADEIHPFIEIDAGRRVEAVLLEGVDLRVLAPRS